jgi:hypothetical protein
MPRALSIKRSIVPLSERTKYLERLKTRKDYYKRAVCEFWVFEEAALTGAFIEFVEAADAATLEAAHAGAPEPVLDPARIYTEVELT